MACVTDYNLLKEGEVYNVSEHSTSIVTSSGIDCLYDGDVVSTAYEIPVGKQAAIEVKFGEYFDVCNIKYYASSLVLDDISIGIGKESYTEVTPSIVSSGTYLFVDIAQPVGYLRITHSGTSSVNVQQLFIEGIRNDDIGFGTSSSGEVGDYFLGNTPIQNLSSDYMSIPVFNEYPFEADVKVSVESTGELEDKYVYLSDSPSGSYYGINDYGKTIPAFVSLKTSSDSLVYTSFDSLYSNWDVHITSESFITLGEDYLQLNVMDNNNYNYRTIYGSNDMRAASFVAKDYFTGDQSFTVSLKVRYYESDFKEGLSVTENKVLVGMTDTFPILENSTLFDERDYPYYNRGTNSLAATWFGGVGDTDLRVGGAANSLDYDNFTDFNLYKSGSGLYRLNPLLNSIKMEDLSSNVYGETEYLDDTTDSLWRELKLSYNHTTKECYYFVDDVQLDSFQFFSGSFFERCKLFFCFIGEGPAVVQFKDFSVVPNKVLVVQTEQSSATAVDSSDETNQGPEKLINKKYDTGSVADYVGEEAWVSGNSPDINDYFIINFGAEQDLDAVRIKQIQSTSSITISGSSYGANLALKSAVVEFDTGDVRLVEFVDPMLEGTGGWDVSYLLTTSGTIEPVSGVSSATVKYSTFYDRGQGSYLDVFGIDEIEFYSLGYLDVNSDGVEDIDSYTWSTGHIVNLKSNDSHSVFSIGEDNRFDVAGQQDKWRLFRYADYDGKNLVRDVAGDVGGPIYHYGESLFAHSRWGGTEGRAMHLKSGAEAWVWRYFPNKVNLAAFYAYVVYYTLTTGFFHSRVDTWKLQYLVDGGNPNVITDWVDIPPITSAHSSTGYDVYSQYLVDHNDGEYYTDFADMHSSVPVFTATEDLYCRKNSYNQVLSVHNRTDIYVEFDETYYTQGIKLVIGDGYDTLTYPSDAEGYSITSFLAYADQSSGYYLSPVFDMGTKQNTERIWTDVEDFEGSSDIFYRSYSVAPNYMQESFYEVWQDFGAPYTGLDSAPAFGYFYNSAPILSSDGEYIYVFPTHPAPQIGNVLRINLKSKEWEEYVALEDDADGGTVAVDPRTYNPVVYIGGAFLVATRSGDNPYTSGLSLLHLDETQYSYTGWENFFYQRQTSAVYAAMVYDGSDRVFFLGEDLEITVFFKSTGELTSEGRTSVPGHGYSTRQSICAAYADGKIYVAGGNSSSYLDIYDVAADTWVSGSSSPNNITNAQMIHVNGWLYVMPITGASRFAPCMKYQISTDTWYELPSMNYNSATFMLESQYGNPDTTSPTPDSYCLHGDYIYSMERFRSDFRRVKVVSSDWSSGHLPSFDIEDSRWFNNGGMPWNIATVSGEYMPQDRYVQYKVVLNTTVSGASPVVSTAALVQPVTISGIDSGGYKNIYAKTNITDELDFDLWYTGRYHSYGDVSYDSIIYTKSNSGTDFYGSTIVEESSRFDIGSGPFCFRDPYVIQEGSGFTMWAVEADVSSIKGDLFEDGNIHRATSEDKYNFGSFSVCLSKGAEGTYDVNSVYGPCVIKDASYKMWYTGDDASDTPRIMYATSSDGITWASHQLSHDVYTSGLSGNPDRYGSKNPAVFKTGAVYWMYYEGVAEDGDGSIILCKSTDGLNWANHEVVINSTSLSALIHDCSGCGSPCVVEDGDLLRMWFVAYSPYGEYIVYSSSVGGSVWSSFSIVLNRGELGYKDRDGVSAPFVMLNRSVPDSNTFFNVKLKMYND